jgi:hypothetical protein
MKVAIAVPFFSVTFPLTASPSFQRDAAGELALFGSFIEVEPSIIPVEF